MNLYRLCEHGEKKPHNFWTKGRSPNFEFCPGGHEASIEDVIEALGGEEIIAMVNSQAEDEGLWFMARTAPEAYLQQELRALHSVVERILIPALDQEKET